MLDSPIVIITSRQSSAIEDGQGSPTRISRQVSSRRRSSLPDRPRKRKRPPAAKCSDWAPSKSFFPEEQANGDGAAFEPWLPKGLTVSRTDSWLWKPERARETLLQHFAVQSLDGFGLAEQRMALQAAGALLAYLARHAALGARSDHRDPHVQRVRLHGAGSPGAPQSGTGGKCSRRETARAPCRARRDPHSDGRASVPALAGPAAARSGDDSRRQDAVQHYVARCPRALLHPASD